MNQKVNSLIQFAKRARNIAFKQTLHHFLNKNKVGVVIVASDISENTLAEFNNHKKVKFITYLSKQELGNVLSKDEVSIVGILDRNIANQIIKLLEGVNEDGKK